MFLITVRQARSLAVAATMLSGLTATGIMQAQVPNTAPNVLYTAAGTFGSPTSGDDPFKLQGEPFNIVVVANTATTPNTHGTGYATYTSLKMRGTVHTGLDPSGVPITSNYTFLVLALGNPNYDIFEMQAPVIVIKKTISISAKIQAPKGTITKLRIYPFSAPVNLTTTNATVTYVNGTDSTTLTIASGTLTGAYPTPPATRASMMTLPRDSSQPVESVVASIDVAFPEERFRLAA